MNQIQYRRHLPELMKSLKLPMIATELGVAEGNNANDLVNNGIELLYAVDLWSHIPTAKGDGFSSNEWHNANLNATKEKVKKHGDKVKLLRGLTSEVAWQVPDNTCGLVYIDAAHDYQSVTNDIWNYWDKLVSGGIMAFHDYENEAYGVKQAVQDFATHYNLQVHLICEDKLEDAGAYLIKP
jgi:hypothetical protein